MWSEYFKEREGLAIIETDKGCAAYRINGSECYIKEIFVKKEHRRSGEAFKITDQISEIAKLNNCTYLTGTVVPSLAGSTECLSGMIKYGFKLHSSQNDFIVLVKEI